MRARQLWIITAASVAMSATPALARDAKMPITIPAGRLSDALGTLSLRSRTGLLYASDIVGTRSSPGINGRMTVEDALRRLLIGTGLAFRRTGAGTIIVYIAPPAPEPAIPDILVVGRRTQNEDIRRTQNDIQPYHVIGSRALETSQADNVDQFLRMRLPSDATARAASQDPIGQAGSNQSQVNLYGLGPGGTLILIDGARMPGAPAGSGSSFSQPDLNGIPLLAIDRIETLTATAGGIYGPGATGGMLNIVLKRDYRGADLVGTLGISDRGDAIRRRIDGRIGFTPDSGATDVMIAFSHSEIDGLHLGQRDYSLAARRAVLARDPLGLIFDSLTVNGLAVTSSPVANLVLKPAFGGADLGSRITYLPAGYAGLASDGGAALVGNAGQFPNSLSPDGRGTQGSLTSDSDTSSLFVNIRHRFSDTVEMFVDFIGSQNNGKGIGGDTLSSPLLLSAAAPTNPFQQDVSISFPLPGFNRVYETRLRTIRASVGAIVQLPGAWHAEARYSLGWARSETISRGPILDPSFAQAVRLGLPVDGGPPADPFGDLNSFITSAQAHKLLLTGDQVRQTHFEDASLRLAGRLLERSAGTVSLTLLAEHRREAVPVSNLVQNFAGITTFPIPGFWQSTSSFYGELRAPIVPRDSGFRPMRGFEVQLAARYDDFRSNVPRLVDNMVVDAPGGYRRGAAAYTFGARSFPQEHVMLRASISTGVLPPTPSELLSATFTPLFSLITDPKRGGNIVGSERDFTLIQGGSTRLQPARARSLSVGLVINPDDGDRPRISFDYTHIQISRQILSSRTVSYFVANESRYPGRVERAPLTAADAALGYTGGVVTRIDATYLNAGRILVDAVDLRAEYRIRDRGAGRFRLYAAATWQPRLKYRQSLESPELNGVGYANLPLRWRGNAGLDWDRGPLSIGINGQYYGHYLNAALVDSSTGKAARSQPPVPGARIPAQFYLDLFAAYKLDALSAALHDVELRFGVADLLGKTPPLLTTSDLSYSYFGDPRGRRFETSIAAHF